MSAIVSAVETGSIAEELELVSGDIILSINTETPKDLIDYRFLICSELIELEIQKQDGEIEIIEIEKDFDEDLGIIFESAVFDKIKPCANNCIFCFVDQQPKGLRDTLYVKDDDYRLSYLQGTYVTLTNLTLKDKQRIAQMHLGPLYVSVHTTNPDLRAKMLKNKRASEIMDNLKWLNDIDIPIHTQIVLCPGYNDGEELKRTLNDLYKFKNIVMSVAIVPVGVTKFREEILTTINEKIATETIQIVEEINKKAKMPFAQASDEFYLMANKEIPKADYYNGFAQIEDGVGAIRLLTDDFEKNKKKLPKAIKKEQKITLITSFAAKSTLENIAKELNKIENLTVDVIAIESNYWGEKITVAGLVTGTDILEQLQNKDLGLAIIPSVMLKAQSDKFLDGITLTEVKNILNTEFKIIEDIYSVQEIISLITDLA